MIADRATLEEARAILIPLAPACTCPRRRCVILRALRRITRRALQLAALINGADHG